MVPRYKWLPLSFRNLFSPGSLFQRNLICGNVSVGTFSQQHFETSPSLIVNLNICTASVTALSDSDIDAKIGSELIKGAECNCPNDCEETVYSHEMSQAKMRSDAVTFKQMARDQKNKFELLQEINDIYESGEAENKSDELNELHKQWEAKTKDWTLVHIYFKELGIVKYVRDELYGIMDVIGMYLVYFQMYPKCIFTIFQRLVVELLDSVWDLVY
jgi:hypothetical protein